MAALSNNDHQKAFLQRRKQEKALGLKRAVFMLTQETTTRIDALAGFYELKPEEVITRAIQTMWQDRLVVSPTFITQPRTVKVADDLEPEPEPAEPEPLQPSSGTLMPYRPQRSRSLATKGTYKAVDPDRAKQVLDDIEARKNRPPSNPADPDQAENGSPSNGIS